MERTKESVLFQLNTLYEKLSDPDLNRDGFLDDFIKEYNEILSTISKELSAYGSIQDDIIASDTAIEEQTANEISKINANHDRNNSYIEFNSKLSVNKLKEAISTYTKTTDNIYTTNADEKLLVTSTTNPFVYSDLITRNSSIELYNTNKKEILSRYDEIVNKMTKERNDFISSINSNNNKYMHSYTEASTNIINNMNDELKRINIKINNLDIQLNELKTTYDKKSLDIEKKFNEAVRKNNRSIANLKADVKKKYDKDKSQALEEKYQSDNKSSLLRSQAIKEFAQEIAKLNDKIDALKNNQKVHIKENTNIYELNIFDLKAEIRHISEETLLHPELKKINKVKISQLNKKKKFEMKVLKKKLKTINKNYDEKFDYIDKEKDLQESIKNNQIEKVNNILVIDEAAYLNKLSILQQQYDFDIDTLNRKSDFDVKKLRSKFDEEKLDVMKEYKIKQTHIFKKKQALVHKAELINDEIEMARKLEEQVRLTNRREMENELSKSSINSLLEIEKNDMLTEYQAEKIDRLIEFENNRYLYNEQMHFSKRDRKHETIDANTKRATLDLNHNKIIYSYEIEKIIAKEAHDRTIEDISFSEKNGAIKANFSYALFTNKKKALISEYNLSTKLYYSISRLINNLIFKIQLSRYTSSDDRLNYYINTLRFISNNMVPTVKNLLDDSMRFVSDNIESQINLETGAKFEQLLEALARGYQDSLNELKEREENIQKTIENYNTGTKKFYSSISQIDLKVKNLTRIFNMNHIDESIYNKELAVLAQEKKRFLNLINKNDSQIDTFKSILAKIPKRKEHLAKIYEKKKASINKKQQDEASILYDSLMDFKNFYQDYSEFFDDFDEVVSSPYNNPSSFIRSKIIPLKSELTNGNKYSNKFINIIDNLESSYKDKYQKLLEQNNISYINQKKSLLIKFNKKMMSIDNQINEENEKYAQHIKEYQEEIHDITFKYEKKENEIKDMLNKQKYLLNKDLTNLYKDFYKKTTAIKLSLLDNIESASSNRKTISEQNKESNESLVSSYVSHKEELINKNKKAFADYELTFYYLPSEFKTKIKALRQELADYEKEFNNNEKALLLEFNKSILDKNREASRYSNAIHNKIIRINSNLSKSRKVLAQLG